MALVRPSSSSDQSIVLQFSHGNGFPASSYRKLFAALDPHYQVHAVERIGHDPLFPVSNGWPHLLQELLVAIDAHHQPLVLLGHSLGGILSIAAARLRPAQVRAVVILDSPVLSGWRGFVFRLLKLSNLDARFSPAAATTRRRVEFDSLAQALAHFRSKAAFRAFDDEALTDYLGRPPSDVPVRLAFEAAIEADIYRTIPHRLTGVAPASGDVPMGFLAGCRSHETRLVGLDAVWSLVGSELRWVDGSHLFPMERPVVTAALVNAMFERLLGGAGAR